MLRAFVILLLATAPLHAQGSLAEYVPPSTPVLIEFDDLGGYEQWTKNSALGRIWVEPEMQRFVQGMKQAISKGVAAQRARGPDFFMMAGLEPADFLGIEVRRAGVAVCDVVRGHPDVVLMIELRKGTANVEKILRQFRMAFGMFLGATWTAEDAGDKKIWHVTMGDYEFAHVVAGNRVLFTTGRARLKETLARIKGAKLAALAGQSTYRATLETMGAKRAQSLFYLNAPAVYRHIEPFLSERERREAREIIGATGLDAVEAIAVADVPVGANLRSEFCIKLKERRGFFKLFQAAPTTHRFVGRVPRNPLFYGSERFDTTQFLKDVVAWAETIEPGTEKEYRALLDRYNRVIGIDLEKDLVGSLGDEWSAYVGDTPGGSLIPDMVMMISLKDRARFEASLRAMVESYPDVLEMHGKQRATSVRHRRTKFAGRDIHLLELADRRGDPIPIVPSWTFGEDYVAFALWPHALKHMLTNRPSFDGNEAFRKVLEQAPAGAASQGYFDLPRVVGFAYNTVVPMLQGVQGAIDKKLEPFGVAVNLHDLPRAEVITKHLTPCVSYTKVEDGAIRMGYVSPFGLSLSLGSLAALGAVAGGTAMAVEKGNRVAMDEAMAAQRAHRRIRELELQLVKERERWAARLARLEAQLAELKKLIEEQR
ncbi:MAG: DUF3352 domain-containing protein [Planctomycetota bacterium]